MVYLVLYDSRGQCQRVASVGGQLSAAPFIQAGFVEVSQDEFARCAALVDEATQDDLRILQAAQQALSSARSNQQFLRNLEADPDALERKVNEQQSRLQQITQNMISGSLSEAQWYRRFSDVVVQGNLAGAILAVGGIAFLSTDILESTERTNETQLRYLNGFRRNLSTLSDAQKLQRAGLYAGAMRERYWTAHTRAQGLVLPAMPGVRTSCGSNCKCNWNIIQLAGNGNWDCQWRISAQESCEECLRRQRVFNPLRVRNFIPQLPNLNGIYR